MHKSFLILLAAIIILFSGCSNKQTNQIKIDSQNVKDIEISVPINNGTQLLTKKLTNNDAKQEIFIDAINNAKKLKEDEPFPKCGSGLNVKFNFIDEKEQVYNLILLENGEGYLSYGDGLDNRYKLIKNSIKQINSFIEQKEFILILNNLIETRC
ncbi:hypothetical protein RCG23_25270 [Neobacillus sp. PS3-34]|uniref:hypothetical protein n=1 Tax=Neobacillus sp. PS3-34 TaxID=3070678 RepID=UPI0027DF5616|nr:hypothetical protein [Neobacillus sp. PS3-34]WML48498.1 hypothetical protein RCG23_25270 [Neobacillus sp. PS3-34]